MINRTDHSRLIDRAILESCQHEFRPLSPLRKEIPSGTLYRHVRQLVQQGLLGEDSGHYRATDAGMRWLIEATGGRHWDRFEKIYAPLSLVPTRVHQAMIELIFAAVVARQHRVRADRHPFFACFGRTLRWKSSLGCFVCYALGLDPATHVVDCGSESGKSLSFRRSSSGGLVSRRELLDGALVVLDEFLNADAAVRASLGLFLSGRLEVPLENESLVVRPVPLLTMNPRNKTSLEERIGLPAPLIRRAILADFDAVPMPDLATVGERALDAARAHGPLAIPAPAVDCGAFHDQIVGLTRALLVPEVHGRVDVEIFVNLSSSMTAFIPEPGDAIAQVAHGLGIVLETLGWTRPGWIEAVLRFALEHPPSSSSARSAIAPVSPGISGDQDPAANSVPVQTLSLRVPRSERRDGILPDLALDDVLKARFVWFAVDSGLPLRIALGRLLDFYLHWRRSKATVDTLFAILRLAEALNVAEVNCNTLADYLAAKAQLAKYRCTFEDVPEALQLLELLGQLPTAWTWDRAQRAIQGVAKILTAGIEDQEIEAFLDRHQHLIDRGFDEDTAEAIARILTETGATGERRDLVIRVLLEEAGARVDRDTLEQERQRLQQDVARFKVERAELSRQVKGLKTRATNLQVVAATAFREKVRLDAECQARRTDLDVVRGLHALLLGNAVDIGPFLGDVERLQQFRRQGHVPGTEYAGRVADLRAKTIEFFQRIVAEAKGT